MSYIGNSQFQGIVTGGNIQDGSIESIDLATLTNIDINSGSIDGTIIGASEAAAGKFTEVSLGDNAKATFGVGNDLEIYHNGSNSFIKDTGDGILFIQGSGGVRVLGSDTSENLARFNENSSVQLYHDNVEKLQTTSTGVDVTGTITADGLTVSGNSYVGAGNYFTDNTSGYFFSGNGSYDAGVFATGTTLTTLRGQNNIAFVTASSERMRINSAGNVGIGTNAPSDPLEVAAPHSQLRLTDSDDNKFAQFSYSGGSLAIRNNSTTADSHIWFNEYGKMGLGTKFPDNKLHIVSGDNDFIQLEHTSRSGKWGIHHSGVSSENLAFLQNNGTSTVTSYVAGRDVHLWYTGGNEVARIESSGYLGLGTTSPSSKLHVDGGSGQELIISHNSSDPGLNIIRDGTVYAYLFVDTSDGLTCDIEGPNGVNVNGAGGTTISEFTTSGMDLVSGRYKYKSTDVHSHVQFAYNRFSNPSSTTAVDTWYTAAGSSFTFVPKRSDTRIKIIADVNMGVAWTNPSGANHGSANFRIKVQNSAATYYSTEYIYWGRVDNFSGVFENIANGIQEYVVSSAINNGSNVTISIEYQIVRTSGTGLSRGGVNTWGGTSLITVEEFVDV